MKKIILHRAAADNAGGYQDAGATLTIADGVERDTISAERAKDLLDSAGAALIATSTREPAKAAG